MTVLEKLKTAAPPDIRDRCDSTACNAPALVRVVLLTQQDLVFCGHHFDHLPATFLGVVKAFCDTRGAVS